MLEEYLLLGLLQGLFEWLPVSSEGVVAVAAHLLRLELNEVDTALFLHLGTALSVLVYFRQDWLEVFTLKNKKLVRFLLITTGLSLTVALPIYKVIRTVATGRLIFFITGFALLLTAYFHRRRPEAKLGWDETALLTGLLQALSVIPGVSRSGSTMFGLAWGRRMSDPSLVLKLSYLASVPVVLISSLYLSLSGGGVVWRAWPALPVSFVVGFLFLHLLLKLVQRIDFFWFVLAMSVLSFMGGLILL